MSKKGETESTLEETVTVRPDDLCATADAAAVMAGGLDGGKRKNPHIDVDPAGMIGIAAND